MRCCARRRTPVCGPDVIASWEITIAKAAARLGLGQADEAVSSLGALIAQIEPSAHDDFMNRQVLDLARAVRSRALLDAGRIEEARRTALQGRATLRPALLPRVLVEEVLAALSARERGSASGGRR